MWSPSIWSKSRLSKKSFHNSLLITGQSNFKCPSTFSQNFFLWIVIPFLVFSFFLSLMHVEHSDLKDQYFHSLTVTLFSHPLFTQTGILFPFFRKSSFAILCFRFFFYYHRVKISKKKRKNQFWLFN